MALKDLINTLSTKIEAAATGASPEELAYLSSAVEKIGGRVSVFDFNDFVDDKKSSLTLDVTTIKADALDAINTVLTTGITNLTTLINTSTNDLNETVANAVASLDAQIATIVTDSTNAINALKATTLADIETAKTDGVTTVSDAAATAVGQIYGSRSRLMYLACAFG